MSTLLTAAAVLALAGQCQHTYPPDYIEDIAKGESLINAGSNAGMFNAAAVHENRTPDGTIKSEDIGLMQINTQHLSRFGLTKEALLEPCVSIAVAEQILRELSSYNSGTPTGSLDYAKRAFLRMRGAASVQSAAQPVAADILPNKPNPFIHPAATSGDVVYSQKGK